MSTRKPTSKKHLFLVPGLALATVALAGPASAAAPVTARKPQAPAKAVLLSDASRMTRLFSKKMNALPPEQAMPSMRLDLGNEAHYQFVLHRVLAAGNTPDNSPRLFASLEKARELARSVAAPSTQECSQIITLEDSNLPGTVLFKSAALASCFGNDGYLFSDLQAYQANAERTNHTLLDRRANEDYGTHVGGNDRASLELTYRYEKDQLLQLDSLVLGFDAQTGAALASYATVATSGLPESQVNTVDPSFAIYHPKDLINSPDEQTLRVCLERGAYTGTNVDCDYASVVSTANGLKMYPLPNAPATPPSGIAAVNVAQSQSTGLWSADSAGYFAPPDAYNTANTYVPLHGQYYAGDLNGAQCTITSYDAPATRATLYMVQPDSTFCNIAANTNLGSVSLTDAALVTNATNTPFRKMLNFGQICVGYEKTVKLVLQLGTRATCGTTTGVNRYKTFTISPIQFRNSCFGEGTQVTLADGSTAKIENVKVGDKVIANDKGLVLTVTTLSRGSEGSPMVRIKDDQGHEAFVTQTHPVMTANRGVLTAQELKVNDQLVTAQGTSTLTSLTREMHKGLVYNLALGTPEELKKAGLEHGMLFAGGFLMGDYAMQNAMDARRAKPSMAQASIPQQWAVDYVNDQAHGARK
ncbi:MAG TPA: Hint domain-containing protein [Archangium sp.]|nr:Hint domain-containing protein [Archangium sp.]